MRIKFNRVFVPFMLVFAMLAGTLALGATPANAYTQGAGYPHDGQWWGDCNGRSTVATKSRLNTGGTAKLQVFYCTQGYYFARASTTYRTSLLVEMWRDSPYRLDMQIYNGGYAVMTNGVARRGHTCYHAYFSNVGQINFCN